MFESLYGDNFWICSNQYYFGVHHSEKHFSDHHIPLLLAFYKGSFFLYAPILLAVLADKLFVVMASHKIRSQL